MTEIARLRAALEELTAACEADCTSELTQDKDG